MPVLALGAPNAAAADAGEQVARAGGSSVDAAIAAALVAMVNEVGLVSPSAGAFLTVQPPDGSPAVTVDGWMDMPGRGTDRRGSGTWDITTDYGGGVTITVGAGSVATHGALAAFGEAHARWGRVPWADLVAPAVDVARRGFRLGAASRFYLEHVQHDVYGWDETSAALLAGTGGGLVADDIRMPDLADALERVAANGPDELTTGDTGRAISADVVERGGLLTVEDLAAYRPVVRDALRTRVGDWVLATNPPPSVGGVCVAAMLALLDGRPHGAWTADDVEHIVRVQRAVLGHRLDVLEHAPDLAEAARAYLEQVDAGGTALLESGSTAQFSAVDDQGGACSLTVSSGYGSGMVARGTGIWLNNCLGEQELNPRGLHGLEPGTRLLSNMAPTVGRHADGGVLAIGSPGADRITTAIVQVLAGFANGGLDLPAAIGHPRVHVHRAGRPEEDVKHEGFASMYFGGVIAAQRAGDGSMNAAADPRREGAVRVVERVH